MGPIEVSFLVVALLGFFSLALAIVWVGGDNHRTKPRDPKPDDEEGEA